MKLALSRKQALWLAPMLVLAAFVLFLRAGTTPAAKRKAVVVELFTSEGCSSCPPADALLAALAHSNSKNGAEIIALGFHVDYWNYQGWQDRFSSRSYTQRQDQYAARFAEEPYTPQMVVDGESQLVGSDATGAESAIIQAAARLQVTEVQLDWQAPDELLVKATSADTASTDDVLLAITEDDLTTMVAGGENGGRLLHHSAVVRDLHVLGHLSHGRFQTQVPIRPAKDWKSKDVWLVAFVESAPVGPITGAASVPLSSAPKAAP